MDWNAFFHMGGYAAFVWPSWALAVVVLGLMAYSSRAAMVKNRRLLERLTEERRAVRQKAAPAETEQKTDDKSPEEASHEA